MQLPPFDTLLNAVKEAIQAARELWRPRYIALACEEDLMRYQVQPKISGAAFLVVHPTGHLFCFRRGAEQLDRQVRAALLAEG